MPDKIKTYLYQLSAFIVILSAVFYSPERFKISSVALGVGALGLTITTLFNRYPGKHVRGKRLTNMQVLGGLFMISSAIFMYFNLNYWVICLLIGAILTLYPAFMIPRTLKQEEEENLKK